MNGGSTIFPHVNRKPKEVRCCSKWAAELAASIFAADLTASGDDWRGGEHEVHCGGEIMYGESTSCHGLKNHKKLAGFSSLSKNGWLDLKIIQNLRNFEKSKIRKNQQ
jgi:hypothetical protein